MLELDLKIRFPDGDRFIFFNFDLGSRTALYRRSSTKENTHPFAHPHASNADQLLWWSMWGRKKTSIVNHLLNIIGVSSLDYNTTETYIIGNLRDVNLENPPDSIKH